MVIFWASGFSKNLHMCLLFKKKSYSLKQMVRGKEEEGVIECLEAQIHDSCQ